MKTSTSSGTWKWADASNISIGIRLTKNFKLHFSLQEIIILNPTTLIPIRNLIGTIPAESFPSEIVIETDGFLKDKKMSCVMQAISIENETIASNQTMLEHESTSTTISST